MTYIFEFAIILNVAAVIAAIILIGSLWYELHKEIHADARDKALLAEKDSGDDRADVTTYHKRSGNNGSTGRTDEPQCPYKIQLQHGVLKRKSHESGGTSKRA